jgi:hypothetical protein
MVILRGASLLVILAVIVTMANTSHSDLIAVMFVLLMGMGIRTGMEMK